ncbi:dihydrolipoyllysine-residue acetyltransferase [Capillimicrobium parvum]|uniref:Acetyltransferase component of pyruvate dehydrogenase complex n=1 Tax=Capillimicrobium parvum TaxID=2884022 RepID=A0A9E6XW09_9ACTN|nr:dihydrolipoyllysine-residue acetyltransferase [Capillimicrobium parvum]UGS35123.1 Dihydrolipoyllysine-residue acetyltransferase component of pyruvate dehydrogenase complex [Capillimicrobium parvum]
MAQVTEVVVPDIGDFAEVPVIEVLVAPGDTVAPEDPLVTLESDKATMDVPAPTAGVVAEVLVAVGDTVSEGSPVLTLTPSADAGAPAEAAAPGAVEGAVVAEASATAPEGEAAPAEPEPAARPQPEPASVQPPEPAEGPPYASPSVRRLARERGVDLQGVAGTGRKGRITAEDVEGLASPAPAAAAATDLGLAPWPQVDFAKHGPIERVPLSRIKRISGPVLHRNWVMIPHVTHHDEADITDLEAFRRRTNEEIARDGVKITMVALLMKACVVSLKAFPDFNASLDGADLVLKRYHHLGFAADTPQGLLVPVIRDVDAKGIVDIARELTELSGRAREGKLSAAEMSGSTFTISSLGGIGGTGFTPIVNAPEVAILGVTRSAMKPVWDGSEFRPRLMLPLSLSYDHRVIDGAAAARFTAHLAGVLSDLRRALL